MEAARRVVARWKAFVAERKACPLLDPEPPLLDLVERHPDLFGAEVLNRLDPADLTVLAQVGRPWLAAVVASGLPRAGKRVEGRTTVAGLPYCPSRYLTQFEPSLLRGAR